VLAVVGGYGATVANDSLIAHARTPLIFLVCILGILQSFIWRAENIDYNGDVTTSLRLLREMEEHLPFQPITRGWEFFKEARGSAPWWTSLQTVAPWGSAIIYIALLLIFAQASGLAHQLLPFIPR
jgi:hypothetical protein